MKRTPVFVVFSSEEEARFLCSLLSATAKANPKVRLNDAFTFSEICENSIKRIEAGLAAAKQVS